MCYVLYFWIFAAFFLLTKSLRYIPLSISENLVILLYCYIYTINNSSQNVRWQLWPSIFILSFMFCFDFIYQSNITYKICLRALDIQWLATKIAFVPQIAGDFYNVTSIPYLLKFMPQPHLLLNPNEFPQEPI